MEGVFLLPEFGKNYWGSAVSVSGLSPPASDTFMASESNCDLLGKDWALETAKKNRIFIEPEMASF